MTPLEAIRIWGLEKLGRYYSAYRAFVIDPQPDDKHIGNILVHIPRVQGGMKIIARAKQMYGGPGFGAKYFQPKAGEIVWIQFENGNPTKPIWSYHTWAENECPEELQDINTAGLVTANGIKVLLNEPESGDSSLLIQFPEGPEVSVNQDSVTITKDQSVIKIEGSSVSVNSEKVTFNDGQNGGLVNISILRDLITTLQKDLVLAKSGTNLASWILQHSFDLEDKKVTH